MNLQKRSCLISANELAWFAAQVNAGNTSINAVLGNDVVFGASKTEVSTTLWTPIGNLSSKSFNGVFDGDGYSIYGINANVTSLCGSSTCLKRMGIFDYVGSNGYVKNVTLASGNFASPYAGGIAVENRGHIENCKNLANISSTKDDGIYVGGIVADNYGVVENCVNQGTVSSGGDYVGGIVGYQRGIIRNCTNSGNVNSTIVAYQYGSEGPIAGGIAGRAIKGATIELCKNSGSISSNTGRRVGGIVAENYGSMNNCYNTGSVSSWYASTGNNVTNTKAGGMVAYSTANSIKNSYDAKTLKYVFNGNYIQGSSEGIQGTSDAMQNNQFAWMLNTCNGSEKNSGVWTRGSTGYPVFATSSSLAIRRISFNDNGSTSNRYTNYQGMVSFPVEPTSSSGLTFDGWYNSSGTKVTTSSVFTSDQTVYSKYVQYYTINFYNGELLLQTLSVASGSTPVYTNATPTKNSTAQYIYSFDGWTPTISAANKDASYQAVFSSSLQSYDIDFKDYDESVLASSAYNYGTVPMYSKTPTRASTAEWDYSFAGWNPEVGPVTGDAAYIALYDSSKVQYPITFNNFDESELAVVNADYGTIPTFNGVPTRSGSAEWTYVFKAWSPSLELVTEAATYTAVYDSATAEYEVSFKNYDGKVLQSAKLEYGTMPTAPSDPSRNATAEWTYAFAGWDKKLATVTGPVVYRAVYDSTKNSYEVTFVDFDNSEIQKTILEYGETPVCSNTPTRESSAEWTYEFNGWNPTIASVTGEITYKAVFDSAKVMHTVSLMSDGSVVQKEDVAYGETFVIPRGVAKDGNTFVGWYVGDDLLGNVGDVIVVTQNVTAEAKYSVNSYMVKFLDFDGTILKKVSYEYGNIPVYGSTVSRDATAEWNYEFIGWTPTIGKVTRATNYTAMYDSSKVKYEVVFMNGNAEVDAQEVEYGSSAEMPADPKKTGYTFVGWNKDFSNVTENLVVEALFDENIASSSSGNKWENSSSSIEQGSSSSEAETIIGLAKSPKLYLSVVGRDVRIAGVSAGSIYAVFDMQGRILVTGRATSANISVEMPRSGSYLIRINSQTKRVSVK